MPFETYFSEWNGISFFKWLSALLQLCHILIFGDIDAYMISFCYSILIAYHICHVLHIYYPRMQQLAFFCCLRSLLLYYLISVLSLIFQPNSFVAMHYIFEYIAERYSSYQLKIICSTAFSISWQFINHSSRVNDLFLLCLYIFD